MKKITTALLIIFILLFVFAGCGENANKKDGRLNVVTTIFPEYDWVRNVIGDDNENVSLTLLLDNGVDLHSFQPTADDIITISTCDLFVYVGGESDKWVTDALKESVNKNLVVIDLLDVLGDKVKEEEIVEGMESEEEEDPNESETEYDEHVWLSLKNAAVLVEAIKDAIIKLDSANADTYEANANAYIEKLNELDGRYQKIVDNAKMKTLLFADRFPFRYMTDDYGIHYFAAFAGCSAESEASFETVAFLANKVDELKLKAVIALEGSNKKIAQTVVSTARSESVSILCMDSMQSVTSKDVENGASYLSIMEKNLTVLEDVL